MKKKRIQQKVKAAGTKDLSNEGKINPFELHVNRERHSVLGRKIKHNRGKPSVSHSKANKDRLEFFQKSSKLASKSNSFIDKRIGEYDNSILREDVVISRMIQARKKKYKKNIFNLNEEELTHSGQPVLNLENMDKPESSSDDDEDDSQLDANFVNKVHFGGFLTKKDESEVPKTHKEIINSLIVESKRKKEEKKAERELNEDLTEKLDKEWKEMHYVISGLKKKDETLEGPKPDTYDMTVHELKFEPRGTAANSLKSEEQFKKKEEEHIKNLEKERVARMYPNDVKKKSRAQCEMSADSIYDGLDIENNFQPNELTDGGEKSFSEAASSSSESDESGYDLDEEAEGIPNEHDSTENWESTKHAKTAKSKNVPLSHRVPPTVNDLLVLIEGHSPSEVALLIESIVKEHHVSLKAENKTVLEKFFTVIAKFLCNSWEDCIHLELLNVLVPHLYMLAQISPLETGISFRNILIEKVSLYSQCNRKSNYPLFDVLVTLKLVGILYPTSDFRHPLVTPSLLLMSDILSNSYEVTFYNILSRLFVSNLFFEFVAYSKRLATEPICFLQDILYMASSKELVPVKYFPRYHGVLKNDFLHVSSKVMEDPSPISLTTFHAVNTLKNTLNLKVDIIFCAVKQLCKFANLYINVEVFLEIFGLTELLIKSMPVAMFPPLLVNAIEDLKTIIKGCDAQKKYLTFPNKRPPMLKMLEPCYETTFSERKTATRAKKLKVEKQLSQKIKKEERGIIREMRRDAQFLARQQLSEKLEADKERMLKVKKLYQELSMQEGEYKKLTKKK